MTKLQYMLGLTLIFTLLTVPIVSSEAPLPFDQEGVIDAIYPSENRLVIYDVNYHLPKSALVYHFDPTENPKRSKSRLPVGHYALSPGKRVGFTAVHHTGTKKLPVIQKIWLLSQH